MKHIGTVLQCKSYTVLFYRVHSFNNKESIDSIEIMEVVWISKNIQNRHSLLYKMHRI